jgi:NAD(P)-dependent dehydrogenase (short-subunit alcohol dehydrogenase family)
MSLKLENKVAVITGATSGLALATAKLFVEEGAFVYITGRRQELLDKAVASIGRNVRGVRADSANLEDLKALFETVKAEKGSFDILYVNSGYADFNQPIGEITEDAFYRAIDINVKGSIFTIQYALPILNDGGNITLTGSIAGSKAFPGMSVYSGTKAALRAFARTWLLELNPRNIRVNILSPGSIDTATFDGFPQEVLDHLSSLIPRKRMGTSEEIAAAALFLASPEASFVNGIELFVDGGQAQI